MTESVRKPWMAAKLRESYFALGAVVQALDLIQESDLAGYDPDIVLGALVQALHLIPYGKEDPRQPATSPLTPPAPPPRRLGIAAGGSSWRDIAETPQ